MKFYIPAFLVCFSTLAASAVVPTPTPSSLCVPQENAAQLQQLHAKSMDDGNKLKDILAKVMKAAGARKEELSVRLELPWNMSDTSHLHRYFPFLGTAESAVDPQPNPGYAEHERRCQCHIR